MRFVADRPNNQTAPRKKANKKASGKTSKKARTLEILSRLKDLYPDATCSLDYETPVQLLVAVILSAQCTDRRVNMVTPGLFARFPDAEALAAADLDELMELVRSTGFYRNKAKNIRATGEMLMSQFGGQVPQTMAELTQLPGVARKTANVVLAHAFNINAGVTVDTHVKRLTKRLGLTKHDDPLKVEQDLIKLLPQPDWENWSIRLIYHGREVCDARKPDCDRCSLADICPSAGMIVSSRAGQTKAKQVSQKQKDSKTAAKKTKTTQTSKATKTTGVSKKNQAQRSPKRVKKSSSKATS
ncbi:endonuclease III, DNA-(apurinic or apyrimidinic site) lyase [Thalassoporum mexicanum PCC 7367]|nr:endonuclease III [Pseudanabaena sp. PCC 7367]AFY70077.1 endonuclease III, DNA-(apurinic or apyrimidinic site) lyase [Pseudanabaena sp. PCC 7367]